MPEQFHKMELFAQAASQTAVEQKAIQVRLNAVEERMASIEAQLAEERAGRAQDAAEYQQRLHAMESHCEAELNGRRALARRGAETSALALSSPTALEVRYACEAASAAACRCWPVVVDALLDRVGAVRDGDIVPLAKASEVERAGGREIALGSLMAVAGAALIDGADDTISDTARARGPGP